MVQNIAEKFNCLSSVQLCISINQIYWKSAKKFSTNPANRQTDRQSNMDKKTQNVPTKLAEVSEKYNACIQWFM